MRKRTLQDLAILFTLITMTLWAYWNARTNPFHFDDALFLEAKQITTPAGFQEILSFEQSRPLTYLSFYLNYQLSGTSARSYHLINLALHCLNALVVYFFIRVLLQFEISNPPIHRWLPLAASGIFALHPIQTEAVNYAYQRSTLLAALFSLLAMTAYLSSFKSRSWRLLLLASALCMALAALSKEVALILPFLMAAFLWFCRPSGLHDNALMSRYRGFLIALAFLALIVAAGVLYHLHKSGEQTVGLSHLKASLGYFLAQMQVLPFYLRLLAFPTGLSIDHDFAVASFAWIRSASSIVLTAFLIGVCFIFRRSHPIAGFLGVSFFLFLAPSSSFIPSANLVVEHRLYMPMIAGSALGAWFLLWVCGFLARRQISRNILSFVILSLILIACAVVSRNRTYIWGDNIRLWSDAVAKAPGKVRPHYNLGAAYLDVDRGKAQSEFMRALQLNPRYAPALYNLGWLHQNAGNFATARAYYERSLQADPDLWRAHHNLANMEVIGGSLREAGREFEETVRLRPDYWPAYQSLAIIQIETGNPLIAMTTLCRLKELQPALVEVHYWLALALIEQDRYAEAEQEIGALIEADSKGVFSQRISELRAYMKLRKF